MITESPFAHIQHPRKKAFLSALAISGQVGKAARAVGMPVQTLYTRQWKDDVAFQEGMELAFLMFRSRLEDEAVRRATEGEREYKFDRDGGSLRHPELCICDHHAAQHGKDAQTQVRRAGRCLDVDCDCEAFQGAPYFIDKRSDTMLIFTMKGMLPEKYGDRMELRGALAGLEMSKLPNWAVARIAAGEHPLAVLASGPPALIGSPVTELPAEIVDATEPAPLGDDAGPGDADD